MSSRAFIAVLALVAAAVLLWVVTAGSDDPSAAERATSPGERNAVKIERRLAKDPGDETLLIVAMKTWIEAGGDRLSKIDTRGGEPVPEAVVEDYEAGLRAWNDYLDQAGDKASPDLAEMAAGTSFQLVEIGSRDPDEATANVDSALKAEKIVCKHDPNLLTLSNLAVYQYFNGENAAARAVTQRAAKYAVKAYRAAVFIQLNSARKRAERFIARVERGLRALEETGEEELDAPIKGYGWAAGLNGYEPGTES